MKSFDFCLKYTVFDAQVHARYFYFAVKLYDVCCSECTVVFTLCWLTRMHNPIFASTCFFPLVIVRIISIFYIISQLGSFKIKKKKTNFILLILLLYRAIEIQYDWISSCVIIFSKDSFRLLDHASSISMVLLASLIHSMMTTRLWTWDG